MVMILRLVMTRVRLVDDLGDEPSDDGEDGRGDKGRVSTVRL